MPATEPDIIQRHGRDLLIPYRRLCDWAGYTLTADHLDRLADRVGDNTVSTVPTAVADDTAALLTAEDLRRLDDDDDPYAGQGPAREPLPCHSAEADILRGLRDLKTQYRAEPFFCDDSDATCARDLDYFDRMIDILAPADPDRPPTPTPEYSTSARELYHQLVALCRANSATLDDRAHTLLHSLVAVLTTATEHGTGDPGVGVDGPGHPERGT